MTEAYDVRPAAATDADEYVRTHIELTNVTYQHYAPAGFAASRRAEYPQRVEDFLDELREAAEATAAGREPFRQHWVAENARGGMVGVMSAGRGVEGWERALFRARWVPPATDFALSHLYLAPGTHGSGLAQRMIETALPGGRPAFLWAFDENHRASAFYRKSGFAPDGLHGHSGIGWGDMPMSRWVRSSK